MGPDRGSSLFELEAEAEPRTSSVTRLKAATALPASGDATLDASAPSALIGAYARELRAMARRLTMQHGSAFVKNWLAECHDSALLAAEDPSYTELVQRSAIPLLESLGNGRSDLTTIHAVELFEGMQALSVTFTATLELIAAFELALVRLLGDGYASPARALGRFLTCCASRCAAPAARPSRLNESGARLRNQSEQQSLLVGESPCMRRLRAQLQDIATAPGSVLILGESGTGKELVAQTLHQLGEHASQPFIAVNCAALPRELFESELFGHERGAFTGSRDSAPGLLRGAERGTVFLDEVTEMPEHLQPKLLRALEQRAVRPVGGLREVPISARVVAASNAIPDTAVTELGGMRKDLFYRLCVHRVSVPPLRERLEDVPVLIAHFLRDILQRGHRAPRGFSEASLSTLQRHAFPGNVRELRNVVEHCCATAKGGIVEPQHLPERLVHATLQEPRRGATDRGVSPPTRSERDAAPPLELRQIERAHIEYVLELAAGNKAQAARWLGLSRHQLYLKLERFERRDDSNER